MCDLIHRFQQNQKCDRHLNLFNEVFFFLFTHCAKFDKNMFFNTLNSSHSHGKPTETQWECVYVCVCTRMWVSVCECAQSQIFWLFFYCIPLTLSSDLYVSSSRSRHVRSCFSISSRRSLVVCRELKAFWSFSIRPIWASFFLTCQKADKRLFNYDMILCFDLWAFVYHTCINREGS